MERKSSNFPYIPITTLKYSTTYLVSKEKHDCTRVIEFIHCIKVWHLCDVDEVGDCKIFHFISGGG